MKARATFAGLQLQARMINPPVREVVSDRPRPLADKSTGPCPDWKMHPPWASQPQRVIFPAPSLIGGSSASGHGRAKWNTNAPSFPSEISIIHFHTFPWEHTVGFEGGTGNLNVPVEWKSLINSSVAGALQPTTWPYRCTPVFLAKLFSSSIRLDTWVLPLHWSTQMAVKEICILFCAF